MSTSWDNLNEQQLAQLMEAYLLGTLTDEQIDKFEASLLRHPEAADRCAEAIETVAMTREVFRDHQEQRAILKRDETLEDFHGLLAELGEAADRAETHLVHLVGQVNGHRPLWQQWQFVIPSAMAALLAIAVILIVTLPTGTPSRFTDNTTIESNDPNKPAESATPILRDAVATLTATHNAQWTQAGGASAPPANLTVGIQLHPGDRLTLTAGFAEITTNDGAIAILEAPATVELLDNNALQLHSGKLVGICETDSSKGFLVSTTFADITDLGTVFGVDCDSDTTRVAVFEGLVEVNQSVRDTGERPAAKAVRLNAHEVLSITKEDLIDASTIRRLEDIELDFVHSLAAAAQRGHLDRRSAVADKPVAYWSFDSLESGEKHHALVGVSPLSSVGSVGSIAGRIAQAASLDGRSRFETDYNASLDLTHNFTITSWVWLNRVDSLRQRIVSNGSFADQQDGGGFGFGVQRSGAGSVPMLTLYGVADYLGESPIPFEQWVHLAVSVDESGRPTFYIDGQACATRLMRSIDDGDTPGVGLPSGRGLWIGAAWKHLTTQPREAFNGRIDELAIYTDALAQQQILAHFRAAKEPSRQ